MVEKPSNIIDKVEEPEEEMDEKEEELVKRTLRFKSMYLNFGQLGNIMQTSVKLHETR